MIDKIQFSTLTKSGKLQFKISFLINLCKKYSCMFCLYCNGNMYHQVITYLEKCVPLIAFSYKDFLKTLLLPIISFITCWMYWVNCKVAMKRLRRTIQKLTVLFVILLCSWKILLEKFSCFLCNLFRYSLTIQAFRVINLFTPCTLKLEIQFNFSWDSN